MVFNENRLFDYCIKTYGYRFGDVYDILRPNYSQLDNTPVVVQSGVNLRRDPTGNHFSEAKLKGVQEFEVFCDRHIIMPGDIIQKTVPDGMTKPITISHFLHSQACIAVSTSRVGIITDQKEKIVYQPVYYSFLDISFPGSSINSKLEDSLRIPSNRIVIFNRDQIFRIGMQLIETDNVNQQIIRDGVPLQFERKWYIEAIDVSNNLMVLTVRNNLDR